MSKYMTPDQARKYLKRYVDEEIPDRIAHRTLETLAADTVEWAVMLTSGREDYIDGDWWYPTEYEAREELRVVKQYTPELSPRLVARRVSAPWEVKE